MISHALRAIAIVTIEAYYYGMTRRLSGPPDSDPFNLGRLFDETYPLVVPRWQRDYSWDPDDQVKFLLEDLVDFFEEARTVKHRYYLLGQIIVVGNEAEEFEIVDGQQRITTLYLLISALLNALRPQIDNESNSEVTQFSSLVKCVFDEHSKVRLKSPFQNGTQVLQHLLTNGNTQMSLLGNLTRSQANLINVYGYIEDWILKELQSKSDILDFARVLLSKVYVTRLIIDDIPVALDYFEKMNRRGLTLAAADLLKNYLFSQIPEDDYDEMTKRWTNMQKELDQVSRKSIGNTEQFVKSWAVSISGSKINGSDPLLQFWKDQLNTSEKIEKFKSELEPKGKLFKSIANFTNPNLESQAIVEAGKHFNGSQFISVLMAGSHLDHFDYLTDLVDRRFIAYVYAKERTASFESVMASWSKQVLDLEQSATPEQILSASRNAVGFRVQNLGEMIGTGIKTLSYSKKSHSRRIRYVLARVSKHLDMQAREGDWSKPISDYLTTARKNVPGLDMDHVLGQTFLTELPEQERLAFNEIGALTLVFSSDHREDTRTRPQSKLNMYKKSRYVFTQSLAPIDGRESARIKEVIQSIHTEVPSNLPEWNLSTVEKRTQFIIRVFLDSIKVEELS